MTVKATNLSDEEVVDLLGKQEGHFLDFKSAAISVASLSKSVSAFANSSGGELFVGIEDQAIAGQRWRGFAKEEDANAIFQMLDRPTVAGTLLFSDIPQAALPKRSAVKVYRYTTTEETLSRDMLAGDPLTVEGPIYDLIEKSVATVKDLIETIKRMTEDGLEDVVYPEETLHEIITNAVLHRDYSIATDIQIRIYDDRVEVESPGRFPGHVSTKNFLDEQFARNPKVVRLINKFPNPPNKDVGEGFNTAFEAMRKIRLKDPEVIEHDNSVLVVIRHARLASPAQIVMEYLDQHDTITNVIGREITGIRRDVQMKDVFVALRNRDLIEIVPGTRGRATAWRKKTEGLALPANDDDSPRLL